MPVKSTYNFVPAPKVDDVFHPGWAHLVSHDIPFSDGESGEIQLTLKAETPVYIRNGHSKKDSEIFSKHIKEKTQPTPEEQKSVDRYLAFSNIDGKYFIPASSLKGMFRNVLEIMSRSKLNKELVNNDRYSFRDLTRNSLYMKNYNSNQVKGGWLKEKEDGSWIIEECNGIYHIHHEEVDNALGTNFRSSFLGKNPTDKSAAYKYKNCKKSREINFSLEEDDNGKKKAKINSASNLKGTIIFTGQPGKRNEGGGRPSGKVHEFVFEMAQHTTFINIKSKQKEDFKFIYLDHDKNNISPDWKFWRSKLEQGEKVPVFYNKAGEESVKHFGLSYMYKLPFEHSIHEMVPISKYNEVLDFSELLFGRTTTVDALKGRLLIGNAFASNAVPCPQIQKEILGSPKASYFPFYVSQEKKKQKAYNTYQQEHEIRGFKRYPVRTGLLQKQYSETQANNPNVFSHFIPLKEGATFTLKIRFHNLRKTEIGALLSAITFHDNTKECFHSIGSAKSFGYGKLKVDQLSIRFLNHTLREYISTFEEQMGPGWFDSPAIKELLAMASNKDDTGLDFPTLSPDNEFNKYKKEDDFLTPFSARNKIMFTSVLNQTNKEKALQQQKQQAEEAALQLAKEQELADQLQKSTDISALETFLNQYPENAHVYTFRKKIEELKTKEKIKEAEKLAAQPIEGLTDSFDNNKTILNGYLKKNKHFKFSDLQQEEIIVALIKCHAKNPDIFYKKKKPATFTEFPWTDIKKWLCEEKANTMYKMLVNLHG